MTEKWAVVTGASSGIGLEIARQLAERGYNLVLVARSKETLQKVQKEWSRSDLEVRVVALDLALPKSPESLLKQTDAWQIVPEVLVNNAGIGSYGPFLDCSLADTQAMLDLNISAVVQLSHLYGQRMRELGGGYMLQIASVAAFQPLPSYSIYAATKSFVLSFSRSLHFELQAYGMSSTALCPGPTATSFFAKAQHTLSRSIERLMMKPEDVARQGLEAMFARQETHVSGLINKISSNLPRLIPGPLLVRSAALFMK